MRIGGGGCLKGVGGGGYVRSKANMVPFSVSLGTEIVSFVSLFLLNRII